MKKTDQILEIAKLNNGIITANTVSSLGISRGNLKYLVDIGKLIKTSRGFYTLPEAFEDEFLNLQNQYKKGVFCLETALFLHALTDTTPNKFNMCFPSTYNLTNPKKSNVLCSSAKDFLYSLGITDVKTPLGNKVLCYDIEKTLCDILRTKNKVDIQIISSAFKNYFYTKKVNNIMLSYYAKQLHVEKKLRAYLEVLL